MSRIILSFLLAFVCCELYAQPSIPKADSSWLVTHYTKREVMIPMRDGVKLFTSIYLPKDVDSKHPILLTRTPYSCAPYGPESFRSLWQTNHTYYARQHYIMVFQDVRGRFMSEGEFEDIRPFNPNKKGKETDEASDTYDTIDWLVKNLKGNNGRVGVFGISYPGFYSTMAALCNHPALKAVSPQAPVTDWFVGDDFHHNGAFMLMDAFSFYKGFGVPRPNPVTKYNPGYAITEADKYAFYLRSGPLPVLTHQYLGDSIKFWNDMMHHPNYDDWWKARTVEKHVGVIKPATLVVGGTFDAEDCYGAWQLYKQIERQTKQKQDNRVVMGPWFHGGWGGRSTGDHLGAVKFGSPTAYWYHENVEFPFFQYHLQQQGKLDELAEATVFFSGSNRWEKFTEWPPKAAEMQRHFLQTGSKLVAQDQASIMPSSGTDTTSLATHYISDPAQPVPHEGGLIQDRTREYMAGDQRFASTRSDVLVFQSPILEESITIAGPILAELFVATTGTDADVVVKVIDVFPDDISKESQGLYFGDKTMDGYQMMVRGEIMRGRYRNSFEKPEPFVPGKVTKVAYALPDVAHTFQKGHRIMVQIQSSWFPLVDRNPQQFVNIYEAKADDFIKARISLHHSPSYPSSIILPVLK